MGVYNLRKDYKKGDVIITSPTQLSLKKLRKSGYMCAIVEKYNHFVKIRQDLFGFIDILAVHPNKKEILGIQACTDTGGHMSKHKMKVKNNKKLNIWLKSGGMFEIWAWAKKGKKGKRKLWVLRTAKLKVKNV